METRLQDEVKSALKRYRRPEDLERHPAQHWSAVQQLLDQGLNIVPAIRQVLDESLRKLEGQYPERVNVLHEQYVRGHTIDQLSGSLAVDPATLYRQRTKMIQELTLIIAAENQALQQRAQVARFLPPQPVVGLECKLAEVMQLLHDPLAPAVLIIAGMGGLGKTTLARHVAYQCEIDGSFAKVVWLGVKQQCFDIWGAQQKTAHVSSLYPETLLNELARELGIDGSENQSMLKHEVRARCQRRPHLIVFDNLETIDDMAALAPVIELLTGPSRVIITTRDRADGALPAQLPRTYIPFGELDAPTSYHLLRKAAQHTQAPALAQASTEDLAQIYAVTGGNPLALWLVAGQARDLPWQVFLHDLVEHCPRGSSSYDLYDYLYRRSWSQLSDGARTVLFAMHRCESGAAYDLLLALSDLPDMDFQSAVTELRSRMLLLFDGHYTIHRLTYTFLRVGIVGWWS